MTKVTAYKGFLCIDSEAGAYGQIGAILSGSEVSFSPEAIEMISGFPTPDEDEKEPPYLMFEPYESEDGFRFGWRGNPKVILSGRVTVSADSKINLLTPTEGLETAAEFVDQIEKIVSAPRVQIFAYKGYVGISGDMFSPGILSDREFVQNMGIIADLNEVQVSPEAIELLKTIKVNEHEVGDVDVLPTFDGDGAIIAIQGGYDRVIVPSEAECGTDTNWDLLKPYDGEIQIPEMFRDLVEIMILATEG